jgi:hypothetical protein
LISWRTNSAAMHIEDTQKGSLQKRLKCQKWYFFGVPKYKEKRRSELEKRTQQERKCEELVVLCIISKYVIEVYN